MTTLAYDIRDAIAVYEQAAESAERLDATALADAAVMVQDTIAHLRKVEMDLCAALGAKAGQMTGAVSDGRQFTLKRSPDRKLWEHDSWRHDVRREVTKRITARFAAMDGTDVLVDTETSEVTTLGRVVQEALGELQKVHGSSPPLSRGLGALGLYVSDYCVSSPGGWRLSTVRPNDNPTPETGATP